MSSKKSNSTSHHVDCHLQKIEDRAQGKFNERLSIETQLFTKDELAQLINPKKLDALMQGGDDLINYLTNEINQFPEDLENSFNNSDD